MRRTTIHDKLRTSLEHMVDSISESELQDFFEILENQQIHHLTITESKLTPDQVKWAIYGISVVRNQISVVRKTKQ